MKRIIATLILGLFTMLNFGLYSDAYQTTEHLNNSKKVQKKTPTDIVINNEDSNVVIGANVLEVTFANNFSTKTAHIGDRVDFLLNNGLKTKEGTCVLPEGTILVSKITNILKPKSFNRSGKVFLNFVCFVTPDGRNIPIDARLFNNKGFLSRGKLNALGKGMATTLGVGGIGVGAGCGIGVAAGAVIVGGFAIGLPVGLAVGALAGFVTPGLHYKAKAGDKILIQLSKDAVIAR